MNNKIYIGLIFVLSLVLSVAFFMFRDFFSNASSLGLFGIFIINFVSNATFFVSAPSFLTVIAGGNLYSPISVAFVASLGAALGDMVGFLFGFSGRKLAKKKLEKNSIVRFLEKHFRKHGWLIIFLVSFIPNPIFDAIGVVAGILNYSPVGFFIIILIGRFLRYLLLANFGSNL